MAALFRQVRPLCQCQRAFSTSAPRAVSLQWDRNDPETLAEVLPPYPYGPARWFKQSRLGLYGGQRVQFGNNVGTKIEVKTRRKWYPNIFTRKLFSKSLNRPVQVRVSARVLRTIDKLGGLDEYLLGEKEARIKELGESGWWLRWAIMQTPSVKKRFREQRRALGIPEDAGEVDTVEQGFEAFEATAEADEEGTSLEETEPIPMFDDAFQVEQARGVPIIKFRVGPRKHVMLTPDGWRRTRPSQSVGKSLRKGKIAEKFPNYVEDRVEVFKTALDKEIEKANVSIPENERKMRIKVARRKFRLELQEKIDAIYWRKKTSHDERQEERKAARKQARKQALESSSEHSAELEL